MPQATSTKLLNAAALRSAYNVPTTATGAGQNVGIFKLDGYFDLDIAAYTKTNNITQPPLTNVLVDGIYGVLQSIGGQSEATLDIELVNAMVPAAQRICVYKDTNGGSGSIGAWNEFSNPSIGDKQLISLSSSL